jgi:ABC-type transporter Mla MlaB component
VKVHQTGPGEYQLEGVVTAADAADVRGEVDAVLRGDDGGPDGVEVFDLAGVQDGNSVMIALMMGWFREAVRNERQITFRRVPGPLFELIEFYGLDGVLPLNGERDAS